MSIICSSRYYLLVFIRREDQLSHDLTVYVKGQRFQVRSGIYSFLFKFLFCIGLLELVELGEFN